MDKKMLVLAAVLNIGTGILMSVFLALLLAGSAQAGMIGVSFNVDAPDAYGEYSEGVDAKTTYICTGHLQCKNFFGFAQDNTNPDGAYCSWGRAEGTLTSIYNAPNHIDDNFGRCCVSKPESPFDTYWNGKKCAKWPSYSKTDTISDDFNDDPPVINDALWFMFYDRSDNYNTYIHNGELLIIGSKPEPDNVMQVSYSSYDHELQCSPGNPSLPGTGGCTDTINDDVVQGLFSKACDSYGCPGNNVGDYSFPIDNDDYSVHFGADYIQTQKYLGDGVDDELIEITWKMKLDADSGDDSYAFAGFQPYDLNRNAINGQLIQYVNPIPSHIPISIRKTKDSPVAVLEKANNVNTGYQLLPIEVCSGSSCFQPASLPAFNTPDVYDTYKVLIDTANQRYQVYLNGVVLDNFNNPAPNAAVKDWKYYTKTPAISKVSIVLGANAGFNEELKAYFDDVSAVEGACAITGHRICGRVVVKNESNPGNFIELLPTCTTDETDIACLTHNYDCVYNGVNYSDPNMEVPPFIDDAYTSETTGPNSLMTCSLNGTDPFQPDAQGIWCPIGFRFDIDMQRCKEVLTACDSGFVPPGTSRGCNTPFTPNLGYPDYDYNVYCFSNESLTQPFLDLPPYQQACCYAADYDSFNFYQFAQVVIHNP